MQVLWVFNIEPLSPLSLPLSLLTSYSRPVSIYSAPLIFAAINIVIKFTCTMRNREFASQRKTNICKKIKTHYFRKFALKYGLELILPSNGSAYNIVSCFRFLLIFYIYSNINYSFLLRHISVAHVLRVTRNGQWNVYGIYSKLRWSKSCHQDETKDFSKQPNCESSLIYYVRIYMETSIFIHIR